MYAMDSDVETTGQVNANMGKAKGIFKTLFSIALSAILVLQLSPLASISSLDANGAAYASDSASGQASGEGSAADSSQGEGGADSNGAGSNDAGSNGSNDAVQGGGASSGGNGSADGSLPGEEAGSGNAENGAIAGGSAENDATDAGSDEATDATEADDAAAQDDAAQAAANYSIATLDELKKVIEEKKWGSVSDESGSPTIVCDSPNAMKAISCTEPSVYKNATIKWGNNTGSGMDLTGSGQTYDFQGFGSADCPFEGKLDIDGKTLTADRTLFNAISLNDGNSTLRVAWAGAPSYGEPIIASHMVGNGKTLNVTVNVVAATNGKTDAAISGALVGALSGDVTINASYEYGGSSRTKTALSSAGNAGVIANTVGSGTLTIDSVDGLNLDGATIASSGGNAGLLVGEVKDGASLSIGAYAPPGSATVQATNGCAGGIVGKVGSNTGASVSVTGALDLHTLTVKGKVASGGFIGQTTNLSLSQSEGAKVTCPEHVGASNSKISGGFIGKVSFAKSVEFSDNNQIDMGSGATLAGASHEKGVADGAGSVFGVLSLDDPNVSVSFKGGSFKSTFGDDASNAAFGGLIGFVSGAANSTDEKNSLSLLKVEGVTTEFSLARSPYFAGGIVGWLGLGNPVTPAALEINNATVNCTQVASTSNGFGGAVGCIDKYSVADINGLTVSNAGSIAKGAGIAAECWTATIRLGGVTDFSNMHFDAGDATAQIAMVRSDSPSLVFARGTGSDNEPTDSNNKDYWIYKRCGATKIDDLGGAQDASKGYGEVVRLDGSKLEKNLIQLDGVTHKPKGPSSTDWSWQVGYTSGADSDKWNQDHTLDIESTQDFVALALSVQTGGLYNGVFGPTSNMADLLGSQTVINLNCDVDLSGTGIGGLGLDSLNNGVSFSGTFNGNNYKVILAIGEPYGTRDGQSLDANDTSDGNGKIYRHGRLGLFNAVNGASISNVTIAGSMKFDNQSNVDAGALAGVKVGGDTSLTSVTFSAGIEYESTNKDNYVHVGGVFGSVSGAGSLTIKSLESPSTINANITSKAQERGATCVGGAVGYVSGDCVPSGLGKTVEVDGLTISGSISIENGSAKTYAGGFIGQISQGGVDGKTGVLASVKQVEIIKLDFASFSLATAGTNASNSAGLLGYSWAGTEVTLGDDSANANVKSYAITTNGSSVSSATATEFGGLVYAASGHWVINDYALNLSGVTLSAPSANKFGMLVCRAGSGVSSAGESLAGLYLENRAPWTTAYVVNEGSGAITTKASVFDEWVADGCKPGQAVDDCTVNGVVSLHTQEEKLRMADDDGVRNTYENRTVYGKQPEHQANGSVRYYYNLDRAVACAKQLGDKNGKDKWIGTPEQLLVWSVSWYAPKAVRPYVWREADGALLCWGMGRIGSMGGNALLDMTGYSYYPVDLTGINPYVYYSTIKFCFSDINKKEIGNKQNSQRSQHMNMHAGLFSSYSGKNNVTIRSVTLQGSVGSSGGGTGALFTKYVKGDGGAAKVEIKDLTLDGIKVDGAKDAAYAPLLINQLSSKTSLTVKGGYKIDGKPATGAVQGITVKTGSYAAGEKAATSLFGNLGDEKAEMVTANFQDITVPSSKTDGIFTHASLLESFAYDGTKSGSSASYIFYSKNHKEEDSGFTYFEPTYGAEIDAKGNDSEYEGQQRWYNDKKGYMTDDNLVTDGSITANESDPQFANKYLPYVCKSKEGTGEHAHDAFHEIKVNQRVSNLLTGCGTYGDPYALTNAAEVVTVANYINGKESAADGWQVAVIDNQENLCTRRGDGSKNHELIYEYKRSQGSWVCTTDSNKTLSNDTMHSYIQSAYYSIEPADSKTESLDYIELDGNSFKGFGNKENPFRGVIVGDLKQGCDKATLKIVKKTRTISGLIPYSYGCVVKNLNVEYSGSSVATASNDISRAESSDGIPGSFFGGIFGCILGGDNIIDGVTVNASNDFSVAASGNKSHLVPIGGYVGAIAGGGVIFRNSSSVSGALNAWHGKGSSLYDNPYVGRVIDGYAFSEGCSVDNGDANYKINELDTDKTSCIETGDVSGHYRGKGNNKTAITTTVNNAQGLLVLSAIISSGAAGGSANKETPSDNEVKNYYSNYGTPAGSRAYLGGNNAVGTYQFGNQQYGKVRNASYEYVGKPKSATDDFDIAKSDDMKSPGIQTEGFALDYAGNGSDVNSPYLVNKYATWQTGYICAAQVSGMDLKLATNTPYDMTDYGSGFTGLSGRYYSNACASASGADRDRIVPLVACINGNGATIKAKNNTQEYTDDDFCVAGVGGLFNTVAFYSSGYNSESIKANDGAHLKDISFKGCDISLTYITSGGGESSTSPKVVNERVGVGCFAGSTANATGPTTGIFKNVRIAACGVSGGSNAGGLIGTAGWMGRSTSKDTRSIADDGQGYKVFPVQLYDCSYSDLNVSARSHAAGFVGSILSGKSGAWVTGNASVASNSTISIAEKWKTEKEKESADTGCAAGGLFGLAGGETFVNTDQGTGSSQVATIENVTIVVDHKAAGIGGIVGQANKQVSANRVKVTSTKEASADSPTCFGSLQAVNNIINGYAINAGGLAGFAKAGVSADSCTVEKIRMGVTEHAGGLVGATSNGMSASNITVDGVQFDGARCGGILGNCQDQGGTNVAVSNATVKNCSFGTLNASQGNSGGSLGNHSGGVVGAASGTIKIANVLISKNDFKQPGGQGFLLGDTAQTASNFKGLYAAGVDIVFKDGSSSSSVQKPIKYFNDSVVANVNAKSYIAFGSYGKEPSVPGDGTTLYGDGGALNNATVAASPYVTTSPVSSLSVQTASGDNGQTRSLFGDGVNVNAASNIKNDAEKGSPGDAGESGSGHYLYTNFDVTNAEGVQQNKWSFDPSKSVGTYNGNNSEASGQVNDDFSMLVISGNDSSTIESYLNLVTNRGYADAKRLNNADGTSPHVTATVETFTLDANKNFVRSGKSTSLTVEGNGTSSLSIVPSGDYDNGKNRFNLLTVTFSEAGQSYKVQVPIIVKRELQVDFAATYTYGTDFNQSDYAGLGNGGHVLSSYGESMTGLLTWTYNQSQGAKAEFGWDSWLAGGGDMTAPKKRIEFGSAAGTSNGNMPVGTQLTLVDIAHGGAMYSHTIVAGEQTGVDLTSFVASDGKTHYEEQWLSETMGVTAKSGAGTWVQCEKNDARAKAKTADGMYYRVAASDEAVDSANRYTLTCAKDDSGKETSPSESLYLVVRVPNEGATNTAGVNGFTDCTFTSSMASNKTTVLRSDVAQKDAHDNSASTYSILSNYGQTLNDNNTAKKQEISLIKSSTDGRYHLSMDVTDSIQFAAAQAYTNTDPLYFQLNASLANCDEKGDVKGANGFPNTVSGSVDFYVMVGDAYYTWKEGKWVEATEEKAAVTVPFKSNGGDLSLRLSDAQGSALSLAGIRTIAKQKNAGFSIRAKADIAMDDNAAQLVIATSQNQGTDAYTRMDYRSFLSPRADLLSSSSMTAHATGNVGYYSKDSGVSTIALAASMKTQLGINVNDLSGADGATIAMVGTYDFSNVSNGEALLANATTATFTLSLQMRNENGGYDNVPGIDKFITIKSSSLGAGALSDGRNSYVFTDTKSANGFATRDGASLSLKPHFTVLVNTNVEGAGQTYANYRLVLSAKLSGGAIDGAAGGIAIDDTPVNVAGAAGYDNSDYITYTLTKVKMDGIAHK